jgi:phosphoribosyl 1,2-cyclic phosphodiesterase
MTKEDLESPESRQKFISALPPWLSSTVGGNTSCVSVYFDSEPENLIVFDAGSGLRELGLWASTEKKSIKHYDMFFSHFHWDHIMGLPFFNPAYNPGASVNYYSPESGMEDFLKGQMSQPYFPVTMDVMGAKRVFTNLPYPPDGIKVPGASIFYKKMNHPGISYSYMVRDAKSKFIYATDMELSPADFSDSDENAVFFNNADVAVIDSQYTLKDSVEKYNWGHNSFSLAVDFAAHWNIKHLVLFHHEPNYDDRKLYNILQSAKWYAERMRFNGLELTLATEGLEILL